MTYWLDLFTGTTYDQFRAHGATVSGFRESRREIVKKMKPGDVMLCYLTGVKRWVGALELKGQSKDRSPIWSFDEFPARVDVSPMLLLDPEYGIPMDELEGKVSFFAGPEHRGKYKGFIRSSPARFQEAKDGDTILKMLREAEVQKKSRPVSEKLLARKPMYYLVERAEGRSVVETQVSVPEPEVPAKEDVARETTLHTEVQYHLLQLGVEMGFDVWVARNDKSKRYKGVELGKIDKMVTSLPTQFNEVTNKTIELIDVLWLKGNSIVAAFEVECTSSIYSGLLRMSDLLALQPNLEIKLYIVAPDDRSSKVEQEILRPTFSYRDKPLSDLCGHLSIEKFLDFKTKISDLGVTSSLKPEVLDTLADFYGE